MQFQKVFHLSKEKKTLRLNVETGILIWIRERERERERERAVDEKETINYRDIIPWNVFSLRKKKYFENIEKWN